MTRSRLRYLAASLPFLVPAGLWLQSSAVGQVVGCQVPQSTGGLCMYEHIDVNLLLGPVATWAVRLTMPGFILSITALAFLWRRRDGAAARDQTP